MKYHTTVNLAPVAVAPTQVAIISANGTFDPEIALGGHQPRGFDQLMALYDHHVVIYSKIEVDYPAPSINSTPTIAFVSMQDFVNVGALNDYLELSDTQHKVVSGSQGFTTKIVMGRNPNAFLGRSNPLSDPNLKNSILAMPAEQAYWHVGLARATGIDPNAIRVNIIVTYTCVFIEPKDPGQS